MKQRKLALFRNEAFEGSCRHTADHFPRQFVSGINATLRKELIYDHLPLFTCFEAYQLKSVYNSKIRIFISENINNFYNTLDSSCDIDVVLRDSDPNLAHEFFMNHYYTVFDACFPLTNLWPKTHSNSWFDKDL